jgi:hypothetical protein
MILQKNYLGVRDLVIIASVRSASIEPAMHDTCGIISPSRCLSCSCGPCCGSYYGSCAYGCDQTNYGVNGGKTHDVKTHDAKTHGANRDRSYCASYVSCASCPSYQGGGWHQPLPEALLLECLALHLQVDCQRMRLLHLQSDLNQGHGRLRQDHQAHRVDRMAAHHSHAVGPDSPAVGAIRTAGSDRDGLAAGGREAGRESYCDSDHSFAGIDPVAGRHSRAEVAHVGHATVEGRSSTMV